MQPLILIRKSKLWGNYIEVQHFENWKFVKIVRPIRKGDAYVFIIHYQTIYLKLLYVDMENLLYIDMENLLYIDMKKLLYIDMERLLLYIDMEKLLYIDMEKLLYIDIEKSMSFSLSTKTKI